jgi:hypothetical protein
MAPDGLVVAAEVITAPGWKSLYVCETSGEASRIMLESRYFGQSKAVTKE